MITEQRPFVRNTVDLLIGEPTPGRTRRPAPAWGDRDKLSPADRRKLIVERHALVLRGAPIDVAVTLALATVVAASAWGRLDPAALGLWAGSIAIVGVCRLIAWRHARRRRQAPAALGRFITVNTVGMAAGGALWGALLALFAASGAMPLAVLPFVAAILSATSFASAASSWKSVFSFNAPLLATLAVAVGALDAGGGALGAGAIVIYGVSLTALARHAEEIISRSILSRHRHDTSVDLLAARLDAANDSERRFRALVEASDALTFIFSPEGEILYVSPSAATILGASAASFVGRTTRDVIDPADFDAFRRYGGKSLGALGATVETPGFRFMAANGDSPSISGRITNMLYVPGVDGFVFSGVVAAEASMARRRAAAE